MSLMDELESLSNRGYTEGFYNRHPAGEFQNYENGHSVSQRHQFVGEIDGMDEQGNLRIEVKNRFSRGDTLELMTPTGNVSFELGTLISDKNAGDIDVAPGSGHRVRIPMPESLKGSDLSRALLLRQLDRAIAT